MDFTKFFGNVGGVFNKRMELPSFAELIKILDDQYFKIQLNESNVHTSGLNGHHRYLTSIHLMCQLSEDAQILPFSSYIEGNQSINDNNALLEGGYSELLNKLKSGNVNETCKNRVFD